MAVESPDRECSTSRIGELLMQRLKTIDKVAYVRFASVYRDFQDEEPISGRFERTGVATNGSVYYSYILSATSS